MLVNIIATEKRVMGKERCHTATLRSKLNIYADGCTCKRTCGGHIDSTRVTSTHSRRSVCIITTEEIQRKSKGHTRRKMSHNWTMISVREKRAEEVDETHPAIYWTHHVKPNKVRQHLGYGSHPTSHVKLFED